MSLDLILITWQQTFNTWVEFSIAHRLCFSLVANGIHLGECCYKSVGIPLHLPWHSIHCSEICWMLKPFLWIEAALKVWHRTQQSSASIMFNKQAANRSPAENHFDLIPILGQSWESSVRMKNTELCSHCYTVVLIFRWSRRDLGLSLRPLRPLGVENKRLILSILLFCGSQ